MAKGLLQWARTCYSIQRDTGMANSTRLRALSTESTDPAPALFAGLFYQKHVFYRALHPSHHSCPAPKAAGMGKEPPAPRLVPGTVPATSNNRSGYTGCVFI